MKIRPTFVWDLPEDARQVEEKLRAFQDRYGDLQPCSVLPGFATFRVAESEIHTWSPYLTVSWDMESDGPIAGGTRVHGRFGPHPKLWMLFAGFYLLAVFLCGLGLLLGLAQVQLNLAPWGLWLVPLGLTLLGSAYGIARAGQRIGTGQMRLLEHRLREALALEPIREAKPEIACEPLR